MSESVVNTNKNVVAVALDDRMVYGFLVLAHALVSTARTSPFLLVGFFTGELSRKNQALVSRLLIWLGVEHYIAELTPNSLFTERRHLTITTFSKFVLSDLVPTPHLWLDIDTIVRPGWDSIFARISRENESASLVVAEKIESRHTRFDGFNAGVLGWTSQPRERWVEELAKLPEKRFSSEQYLFNSLYANKVSKVDCEFNFLSSWHQDLLGHDPKIIHYSGPVKPWHLVRRHSKAWQVINPTWQFWFDAESNFLHQARGSSILKAVHKSRRAALYSARLHTGKGALASWVMRLLAVSGPLGIPVVSVIQGRAKP